MALTCTIKIQMADIIDDIINLEPDAALPEYRQAHHVRRTLEQAAERSQWRSIKEAYLEMAKIVARIEKLSADQVEKITK